jgi:hypothetical protein
MISTEKRQLPRLVPGEVSRGTLILNHGGKSTIIESVRDISNSGMSLSINEAVAISQKVSVQYAALGVSMEVYGRVAWCSEAKGADPQAQHPGSYLMGVELMSPMMLFAMLPKRQNHSSGGN